MLHGTQKITLTHDSITEAIEDYLQKHMTGTVSISVESWRMTDNTFSPTQQLDVEFSQTGEQG